MRIKGLFFSMLFIVFVLQGCSDNRISVVRKSKWKYVEGFHLVDFLCFVDGCGYKIDDDGGIYYKDSVVVKLVEYKNDKIVIESESNRKGIYTHFENIEE